MITNEWSIGVKLTNNEVVIRVIVFTFVTNLDINSDKHIFMNENNQATTIFWFRRDLRLNDNRGLSEALKGEYPVLAVFIFDTEILNQLEDKSDKRVDFIHQALFDLNKQLQEKGSSLLVLHGNPIEEISKLTKKYKINRVITNRDYEPYARERDESVRTMLHSYNIEFQTFKDQVIFEYNEVLKPNGNPYTIFTPYSKQWKARLVPTDYCGVEAPTANNFYSIKTAFPSLTSIGFNSTGIHFDKPETDIEKIKKYHEYRDFPAIDATTHLSVHLRFGTISIRQLIQIAIRYNETWLNELIWREFFMSILVHFPSVINSAFKSKYDEIKWINNEADFDKWCKGLTGYPIVDAGMRELNATGFMHNRVRMIVASFLTKHLLIDWRWGEAYFAQKLLDYDLSANNGNWQWAAGCGCDAAPYFRVFNPTEQTKKFDAEMEYIRRWVPEFESFEYPAPIVEHTFARQRALNTFKAALKEDYA